MTKDSAVGTTDAPKLPDTLARLAQLAPKRFEHDTKGTAGTFSIRRERDEPGVGLVSRSEFITYLGPAMASWQRGAVSRTAMWTLREALELECQERGLYWTQDIWHGGVVKATLVDDAGMKVGKGEGDSPAHALALALLQALEAQHG